ncbi:hypothetical protein [Oxalicibacterium solurbis]|uniref:hypothetical protein n=1 Tax=Oxalicibacterium solurbis TaxID=69280 RepID=UPI003530E9A0
MRNGAVECWCMALPRMPSMDTLRDETGKASCCLCPDCLRARQQALRVPHSDS